MQILRKQKKYLNNKNNLNVIKDFALYYKNKNKKTAIRANYMQISHF